jgi:hypothetical protein
VANPGTSLFVVGWAMAGVGWSLWFGYTLINWYTRHGIVSGAPRVPGDTFADTQRRGEAVQGRMLSRLRQLRPYAIALLLLGAGLVVVALVVK